MKKTRIREEQMVKILREADAASAADVFYGWRRTSAPRNWPPLECAVLLNACNYRSIRALIAMPATTDSGDPRQLSLVHENLRGHEYFQ